MRAEVRSFAAFRVLLELDAVSASLCLDSVENEGSTITVTDVDIPRTFAGNWLLIDGSLYLIDKVTPQSNQVTLTMVSPIQAFKRQQRYEMPTGVTTIGDFIAANINSRWVAEPDGVYALPYLEVSNLDISTTFIPPELDDNGLFSLSDYIRQVRRSHNVRVSLQPKRGGITLTISIEAHTEQYIVFDDGHSILDSAAYSSSGVAKIETVHPVPIIIGYDDKDKPIYQTDTDGETVYDIVIQNFYLSTDGEVTESVPDARAAGEWVTLFVGEKADPFVKASEKFAKNAESHKVEFWSDRDLQVLDSCRIKLYGEVLESVISYKGKRSVNDRWLYKSGELATTASEKLKGVVK